MFIWRFERAAENVKSLLPAMFREAGFEQVEETASYTTVGGALALLRARKAG